LILSDQRIVDALAASDITIEPFDSTRLGCNSYDVRLAQTLACYRGDGPLDAKADNPVFYVQIPDDGFVLRPGVLYLGATMERVGSRKYVPWLDGKSSVGRLGISVHVTAGRGDVGFINHWTMEISVVQPVKVYAAMPIGQFTFFESHEVLLPYNAKASAKYMEPSPLPQRSAMWKNFR
jgi:dCTP deaminase